MGRYSAGGGAILADGLAFSALFAIVPAVLLAVGVAGLLVSDPSQRAGAVDAVGDILPPLRSLLDAVLAQADRDAGAIGLIGVVGLAWGASRFVVAFGEAIERVMGRSRHRSLLERNVVAIVAVFALPFGIVAAAALAGAASFLDAAEAAGVVAVVGGAVHIALSALAPAAIVMAVALIYRLIPVPHPRWRSILLPALVTGVALAVLAEGFAFLAPRFIGAAALLGTLATVFAALAWLGLSFQAVLIGAAWVGVREDLGRPETP